MSDTITSLPPRSAAVNALDELLEQDLEALRREGLFRPLKVLPQTLHSSIFCIRRAGTHMNATTWPCLSY